MTNEDKIRSEFKNSYVKVMDTLFNTMPYLFWKNREGVYLGCNLNQARAFNFDTIEQFIGKTIYEVLEDQNAAKQIDQTDNHIMETGTQLVCEETVPTPFGVKTYMSQKQPIYDEDGNVIGLLGFSMDITKIKEQELLAEAKAQKLTKKNYELELENYKNITKYQEVFSCLDELQHTINSYRIDLLNKKLGIKSNPQNNSTSNIELTKREQEVLYYLSLNKSPKEIANVLSALENKMLSPATIQSIIDKQLYDKFKVYSIAQLVEKATILKLIPFMLDHA